MFRENWNPSNNVPGADVLTRGEVVIPEVVSMVYWVFGVLAMILGVDELVAGIFVSVEKWEMVG